MSGSQTYELTIFPGQHRNAVLKLLEDYSITDFVESAGEVNADDSDWQKVFEEWSATGDAPLLIYRPTREELLPLVERIHQEFKGEIRLEEKFIADTLWQEAWEPGFEALETERFFIAAPEVETFTQKIRIRLKKAQVFGSGQHATTQALIRLLETRGQGRGFLDVGTGTGVLCLVAKHLGFEEICGTDIEDEAIENAKDNAAINGIPVEWILGSLPAEERSWDTIVCNILPPTLTDLLPDLKARLKKGGEIYLAGFHEANHTSIHESLSALGLEVQEECVVRGWLAWRVAESVEKIKI